MVCVFIFTGCQNNDIIEEPEVEIISQLDEIVEKVSYLVVDDVVTYEDEDVFLSKNKKVYLNDEVLKKSNRYKEGVENEDVQVLVFRERSLLPLRDFADALGIELEWEGSGEKQNVNMFYKDMKIKFYVNSNKFIVYYGESNRELLIETPSILYEGTLYVPIRFLVEVLGLGVDWINDTQIINIRSEING